MSVLWLIALTVAFALLQAVIFHHFNLRKLSYERHFSQKSAFEGQKVELIEGMRNEKLLPVPWLRAESRIPRELAFEKEQMDAHEVSGGLYHKSIFFLPPMSRITRHHEISLRKRGVYDAGSVALTAGDLFSLARSERQEELDCGIVVYPRILSEDELPDPANRWLGEAVVKRWIMPDPFLVNGIRDYRAGDTLRDVHWRASARTGELCVKVRDYTSDPRALVILNVQTSEAQWADVGGQDVETMEQGIRIAATLCTRALAGGMDAGFASNACLAGRAGSGECIFVRPAGGGEQGDRLLDAMARMILHRELNFHTFLESLTDVTGQDILIISCYETGKIEEAMERLRQQGNTVETLRLERGRAAA